MYTNKHTIAFILLFLPIFSYGQILKPVTKKEAAQIGTKTYVLKSGDTTRIVNSISGGLDDPDARFLFRRNIPEVDSVFMDANSKYGSLEEAVLATDRLLREVEMEERISNENNDALSFRIARYNRNMKRKTKEADEITESIFKVDPSIEELVALRLKFGDKPTYYINGVEVPHSVVNQLYPNEVVKKEARIKDTASGNPNGEVWYVVTDKALMRVKIPVNMDYDIHNNTRILSLDQNLSSYLEEQKRRDAKNRLKTNPVVRREITDDGKKIDRTITNKKVDVPASNGEIEEIEVSNESDSKSGTRVLKRTINDQRVDSDIPVSTATSRRSQPVVRVQSVNTELLEKAASEEVTVEEIKPDEKSTVTKDTPKKSVRRIKERHQNKD